MEERGTLYVWTDGGARGNPGPAAIGVVIKNSQHKKIAIIHKCIGRTTNNFAEYTAVKEALLWLKRKFVQVKAEFFLDSELVAKQLHGQFKVKDVNLKKIYFEIRQIVIELGGNIRFTHVRRVNNLEADLLVNKALDKDICQ